MFLYIADFGGGTKPPVSAPAAAPGSFFADYVSALTLADIGGRKPVGQAAKDYDAARGKIARYRDSEDETVAADARSAYRIFGGLADLDRLYAAKQADPARPRGALELLSSQMREVRGEIKPLTRGFCARPVFPANLKGACR